MSDMSPSADVERAFAHITGRARQGAFASRLWKWSEERWTAAIAPLQDNGLIRWTLGTVADDPTVTGGWVLAPSAAQLDDGRTSPARLLAASLHSARGEKEPTINSATTPDTGYYGSHDVTPRERESWNAETEPQDLAAARDALAAAELAHAGHPDVPRAGAHQSGRAFAADRPVGVRGGPVRSSVER
ncbi:MAG: hypothetical protein ACLP01_11615 [Solirubrobacteraceae bacterium]